jgi:hypothetical protein
VPEPELVAVFVGEGHSRLRLHETGPHFGESAPIFAGHSALRYLPLCQR